MFKIDPAKVRAKTARRRQRTLPTSKHLPTRSLWPAPKSDSELDLTNVIAPFDGIVGRLPEQLGSLIKEGDVVTTLSDNSVIWVYFNLPAAQYQEYLASLKQPREVGNRTRARQRQQVPANRQDQCDRGPSQQRDREHRLPAYFPNPDGLLRHGQTGTILISRKLHDATVIPIRAAYEIMDKRYVYVVQNTYVVHQREIVIQNELDYIFVIKKGLDVNDRIVFEGVREIHDGEKVEYEFRSPERVMANQRNHAE